MPVNAGAAKPARAIRTRTRRRVGRSTTDLIRPEIAVTMLKYMLVSAHQRQRIAADPRDATIADGTMHGTKSVVRV